MKRYETSFHVKTDLKTKELVEQIIFQVMTDSGRLITKAEAFGTIVAQFAADRESHRAAQENRRNRLAQK